MDGSHPPAIGLIAQLDLHSPELKGYIAIAMGILGLAYLMYRSNAKRRRDPLESSTAGFSLAQQRSVERQMQGLLVEMADMARQISAQLDTRAARLEALIDQADERIATLRGGGGGAGFSDAGGGGTDAMSSLPAGMMASGDATDPQHRRIHAMADEGRSVGEIARELDWPRGEVELILALRTRSETPVGDTGAPASPPGPRLAG